MKETTLGTCGLLAFVSYYGRHCCVPVVEPALVPFVTTKPPAGEGPPVYLCPVPVCRVGC